MLLTGSINTITTKYADISCALGVPYYPRNQTAAENGCPDRSEGSHQFDHPFVQAFAMFIGEMLCMVAWKIAVFIKRRRNRPVPTAKDYNPLIFLLPALCDCTATSAMYVGLTLTYASQFQMLRGAVIIFTGLMARFLLGHRLKGFQWFGMGSVLVGLIGVGAAAFLGGSNGSQAPNPILGDAIIIAAQVVVAFQMVVEEKFLTKYNVPALEAVGWEGIFGMLIMSTLCLVFWFVPGPRAGGKFENYNDAILQFANSWEIQLAICGTICSIAFFNFSGISVTKEMSATTRMVLDSVRTITIWAYGMLVGWETFSYLQVIGFIFLLFGTFVYNDIIVTDLFRRWGCVAPREDEEAGATTTQGEKEKLIDDSAKSGRSPGLNGSLNYAE